MVTSGRGRHCLALFNLLLLAHTAVAAHLRADGPVEQLEETFDVLTAIQAEVDTMNENLEELSKAIDNSPDPTEEPPTSSTTDAPPSTTDEGTSDDNDLASIEYKPHSLFISKNFLTLEVSEGDNGDCDEFKDIVNTLENAQLALDLVSEKQFANSTLDKLLTSNNKLNSTASCINRKLIKVNDKDAVKEAITQTEDSGQTASDTIDNFVNPSTPAPAPPEDDSGFKSATIALGVLFALSMVAVAGMAIYLRKQNS